MVNSYRFEMTLCFITLQRKARARMNQKALIASVCMCAGDMTALSAKHIPDTTETHRLCTLHTHTKHTRDVLYSNGVRVSVKRMSVNT